MSSLVTDETAAQATQLSLCPYCNERPLVQRSDARTCGGDSCRRANRNGCTKLYRQTLEGKAAKAAQHKRWRATPAGKMASAVYGRRGKYGLEPDAYARLYIDQNGQCAICRIRPATAVDHDHGTDHVRALLCRSCNLGLGHFKDDVSSLLAAAAYVQRHASVSHA